MALVPRLITTSLVFGNGTLQTCQFLLASYTARTERREEVLGQRSIAVINGKENIREMGRRSKWERPSSMAERLSAVAVLIGGVEPKHDGFVKREGACAVSGQFWDR
jgi:hypothetical protein